ncbi:MAG TPA: carboxypeptidase regulatory-like domain-containing protein, partial [Gemmatimonadales bacterium]|nr:carboxypeptidase regulatory-like domain-containing protein [Gemmatimonadales bacterium]
MRPSWSFTIVAACMGLPCPGAAQTLGGSLAGRVFDNAGGASPGAVVTVVELGRTVRTGADGRFTIAPVPPGTWRVTVTWPDGSVHAADGVAVIEDEATELIARPEGVRVTAGDRGGRTTVRVLEGEVLRALPVDDVYQALLLLPGVAEPAQNNAPALRGGGSTESGIRLDGVPLLTGWGRAFALGLGTNALGQVTVRNGPASAAFGDAQSGIISLITRSGGPRLAGDFAYETDNLFGSGVSLGLNRFEGGVGGTVADRLAFFLGGTLAGQLAGTDAAGVDQTQAFVPGAADTVVTDTAGGVPQEAQIPRFVQYSGDCDARANAGASCHGRTLPYDWSTQVSLSGK